jgi:hypothetical protein
MPHSRQSGTIPKQEGGLQKPEDACPEGRKCQHSECLEGTLVFKSSPREAGVRSLLGSCTSTSAPLQHTHSEQKST